MRAVFCGLALALLSACAAPPESVSAAADASPVEPPVAEVPDQTELLLKDSTVVQTATQPLSDLNLIQTKIPPVLRSAQQRGAYALPADLSCAALQTEILALDAALGPDLDATALAGVDPGMVGQAISYVGQKAMGTVSSTMNTMVDGVIPFRSWVRKLSGAERHSKAVAAAIAAGTMRRPYLKGWARASGCVEGPWKPREEKASP